MKKEKRKMHYYFYGGLFIIGLFFAYIALSQYVKTKNTSSVGIITEAEVVGFRSYYSDGTVYEPIFQYLDSSGKTKSFNGQVASAVPAYEVGEKVEIIYDPRDDKKVKLASFWGLYGWTIGSLAFASPFLIIGGGYLLYSLPLLSR